MVRARGERGSATPLLLALVAVVLLGVAGASRVGDAAVRRARADATADVVALAGATAGETSAAEVAHRNRASVAEVRTRRDGAVQVEVQRDGLLARAAARVVADPLEPGA